MAEHWMPDIAKMLVSDRHSSLSEIARQQGSTIISCLVNIQKSTEGTRQRAFDFIESLECLRLPRLRADGSSTDVRREVINGRQQHNYVALSYTWHPSEHEDKTKGSYRVQKRQSHQFEDSRPRDCVLDRIFHYMRTIQVELLWIDQHSNIQCQDIHDCKDPLTCKQELCEWRRYGMAVMDRVYSLSNHPVGLLGRPITSVWELKLLANLLQGKLTKGEKLPQIKLAQTNPQEIWMTVEMLRRITNDDWWQRAWVFQENYRGGTKMKLLISHPEKLERLKTWYRNAESPYGDPIFGEHYVPGELCISSVEFFEETTRFCIACLNRISKLRQSPFTSRMRRVLARILHRAGRYKILLGPSKPMTPQIIADLDRKRITRPWDLLPIAANCCGYSVRLDHNALEKRKPKPASLSLSILVQCLLNGEVLHNGRPFDASIGSKTVPKYIKDAMFSQFQGPNSIKPHTFNKSCRFINPSLSMSGVQTRGHLWKLASWVIDTSAWPAEGGWIVNPNGRLQLTQRKQLAYLAWWLRLRGKGKRAHLELADRIEGYLDTDSSIAGIDDLELSFVDRYMSGMAEMVADAIARGGELILGRVWFPDGRYSPYMGVFVRGGGNSSEWVDVDSSSLFAFTASRPEDDSSDDFDLNDLDRHISFQVGFKGMDRDRGVPTLRIQRWLPGLCFFTRISERQVVFPWPRDCYGLL